MRHTVITVGILIYTVIAVSCVGRSHPTEKSALMAMCLDENHDSGTWEGRWDKCDKKTGSKPVSKDE